MPKRGMIWIATCVVLAVAFLRLSPMAARAGAGPKASEANMGRAQISVVANRLGDKARTGPVAW